MVVAAALAAAAAPVYRCDAVAVAVSLSALRKMLALLRTTRYLSAPESSLNIRCGHRKASRLERRAGYSAFSGPRWCSPSESPAQTTFARMRLIIVLAVGLTYSVLPGVSMIGHIIGLVVGTAMAFLIPHVPARPVVADA